MKQYEVTGMSCAACSAHVEKAVREVPGVTEVAVNLLTNSMNIEGTVEDEAVIRAVTEAGYGASPKGGHGEGNTTSQTKGADALADKETPKLRRRLMASLCFLIPLMYLSMGHMMWNWPLPSFMDGNHVLMGIIQLLFTIAIMVINQKFFISGFTSLIHKAPNMDTLVALGAGASFIYSTYALCAMTVAAMHQDYGAVMGYMEKFYFESAGMILTLITVGKMLEAYSKGKTTNALKNLMSLAPKTATVLRNGVEEVVAVEAVRPGDTFLVRPGESIPVDGIVIEGNSAIDESALTGESIPVDKAEHDEVSAATINRSGFLKCEAIRVGEDTSLSKIIQMVSDAAGTKAPIAKVADRVSGIFVPTVLGIAALAFLVWTIVGAEFSFALSRAIAVLVISCPCALGLATPVAIMVGNGMGAKHGILFKTAVSLEETGKANIVVLDKTGTITNGRPEVTDICPTAGITEESLLQMACSLEQKSEHPLAVALIEYADEHNIVLTEVSEFQAVVGNGLQGNYEGQMIYGGNEGYVTEVTGHQLPAEIKKQGEKLAEQGKTPLYFAAGEQIIGMIAVADVLKLESTQAIEDMRNMGIRVVMLTGDNQRTANAIGRTAGVDEVIAGVLPDGKEAEIRRLQEMGQVIMVGDGINDAPALTRADIGIAIGAGTDVAIDAADVVLMNSKLSDVPAALRLSRSVLRNIHENLFWAFFYNVIGIPLAAGVWYPLFGWELNPMFGAAAMSLSSFCVVTNALRLNLFDVYNRKHDHPAKSKRQTVNNSNTTIDNDRKEKEVEQMERKMTVTGMMCGHCEARVKEALEAMDGVTTAAPDHEANLVVVTLSKEVADAELQKTVETAGYKVEGIA